MQLYAVCMYMHVYLHLLHLGNQQDTNIFNILAQFVKGSLAAALGCLRVRKYETRTRI